MGLSGKIGAFVYHIPLRDSCLFYNCIPVLHETLHDPCKANLTKLMALDTLVEGGGGGG